MLIDATLIERLIAAQFPQWAELPIAPVEERGWDNRSFRLGDELLVRLPSAEWYALQVDKEQRWLPVLAPRLPLPIPVPVVKGVPGEGYPYSWSVLRWLDGEPASVETIGDLTEFATALAGFLAALARIDASDGPPPGPHNFWRGGPLSTYERETLDAIDALGSRIPRRAALAVWKDAMEATWRGDPVWFHGDVAVGNLLVRDGRLAAVIDFGSSGVGDPACDVVICVDAAGGREPRGVLLHAGRRRRDLGARPRLGAVEVADHARREPRRRPGSRRAAATRDRAGPRRSRGRGNVMTVLPPPVRGTAVRILATSDLGAVTVPMRTSHGDSGTCGGVVALLERECERQPTVWLDVGDLVVGNPSYPLLGERPWADVADLPIGAAAVGNHDFDDGVDALHAAARRLSFPLLCANVDVGLPASAMVGNLGVIGLTHPRVDRLSSAPAPAEGWQERVPELARELRAGGARWVVALLHEGVTWWPTGDSGTPVETRSDHLDGIARPWARHADLILAGHNFGAWTGRLAGTPAGEPHLFASSVVVVDLSDATHVRGVHRVPAVRPARSSPAIAALEEPAARVVGELPEQWLTRTGAERYLPDFMAAAFRAATGTDAALVMPSFHGVQAPLDGAIAALGPGPVTELDLLRLVAAPDYDPVVVELRPGELDRARDAYWATADPRTAATDALPWNWCRMPPGVSSDADRGGSVAVIPAVADHLYEWLDRDLDGQPANVTARQALAAAIR